MLHQTSAIAEVLLFFSVFSPGEGTLESSQSKQIQRCFLMAKKLKIIRQNRLLYMKRREILCIMKDTMALIY